MAKHFEAVVTPLGEFEWVFITGMGKENFNKDGYEYTTDVILEGELAEQFKADILAYFHDEFGARAKPKTTGFKDEDDGRTRFTFKTKTTKRDGTALGTYENGSNKGVSLFLNKVQLLDFIPYEGDTAMDELGAEGGYEEPEMAEMDY